MITLDIKDLYVNLRTQNILHITKFWLNKHKKDNAITEQTLCLLKVAKLSKITFNITTSSSNQIKELQWDHPSQVLWQKSTFSSLKKSI